MEKRKVTRRRDSILKAAVLVGDKYVNYSPSIGGREYIDSLVVKRVYEDPEVHLGYAVYDTARNAYLRLSALYKSLLSKGCYVEAARRDNVIYFIKVADYDA